MVISNFAKDVQARSVPNLKSHSCIGKTELMFALTSSLD
jgi:hypothetical protein